MADPGTAIITLDPPVVAPPRGRGSARPRAAHRRGRVVLATAVLMSAIGSCQLPKPPLPKLQAVTNGVAGAVAAVQAARRVPGDRT